MPKNGPQDESSITPDLARGSLYRLAKHPNPGADPFTATDRSLLRAGLQAADVCVNRWGRVGTCPACDKFGIPVLWAEEHVVSCPQLPANLRARRAEAVWSVVSAVASAMGAAVPPLDLLPARPEWPVPTALEILRPPENKEHTVGYVLPFHVNDSYLRICVEAHGAAPDAIPVAVAYLELVLTEWHHFLERAAKPRRCPCCDVAFDGKSLPAHLCLCVEHPEVRRAQLLEKAIDQVTGGRDVGVAGLADDRERLRRAFAKLLKASAEFHGSLGWDNDRYYMRKGDEEAFRPALDEARAELKVPFPA